MMRRCILAVSLSVFFVFNTMASGKIDSLRNLVGTSQKITEKISAINELSREMFRSGQNDSALVYANRAKDLAEKNKDQKGMALAYSTLGNLSVTKADYKEAFTLYSKALKMQLKLGNKLLASDLYNNLGIVYYYQGNYPEAAKKYLEALKLVKALDNKPGIGRSYSNLGNIYFQQGMLDEAIKNYLSALDIQQQIGDRMGQGRSYNNIASVYLMQGKHDKALENFVTSVKIKEEIGDVGSIGRTYLNMGDIYILFANDKKITPQKRDSLLEKAKVNFEKALVALKKIGDKQAMASTYNNMGLLYVARKKPGPARESALKGLALATEVGSPDDIKASYNALAVVDSMTGNYASSLANYKKFIEYRDKLVNDENTKKTMQARMDFELEQKELKMKTEQEKREIVHQAELTRKESEAAQHELKVWSLAGGITLVLLIILLLLNRSRLKQKHQYQQQLNRQQKEKATAILETQEQERKRIAEDLHDSLGHLLSTAKMKLQSVQGSTETSLQAIQLLNQASEELRNISFNLMPNVLEEEGLTPALHELAEKTQQSGKMMVSFQAHDLEKFSFDRLAQFNIYRIVQEATNNILKHAGATETGIQLIGQENNLVIMIEDNGKGFDPGKIQNGRGQRNMRARTQWLNGNFHLDSTPGHGTTISIEIPAYA